MWRNLISALDLDAECHPPARPEHLAALEAELGVRLPSALSEFLTEMDGVDIVHGLSLVWSVDEIAARNRQMRRDWRLGEWLESYMPVDHLLFFGEAGNGDLYAFPITAAGVRDEVFLWNHEDDSRTCESPSLDSWLRGKE